MKPAYKLVLIIFLVLLFTADLHAQNHYNTVIVTDSIPISFDNNYNISGVSIIPFTERIVLRDSLLQRFKDYKFIYSTATFTISDSLPYSIFDTLFVTYQTVKLSLNKEYKRRSLVIKYNAETGDTVRVTQFEGSGFTPEAIFGPRIQKSGTLIRGFTVGTTKDFSLQSGLRLQISGYLSDDIEIVAALTDENTPIQPEGNTERLEELDKVFIQIKHPDAVGTFGDYRLGKRVGEFGVINRKLQGLMGEFFLEDQNAYLSIGSPRGKFNTNNFLGTDGVQGPYSLTGINGEKNIIVIAGTEKVFIDGIQMRRGENADYIIEYSNATVTFTPQRLIISASRISVDFEYTSRQFNRNFLGGGVSSNFFNNKLNVQFQYIQEGDDENSPVDITLTEEDKQIIMDAGDNQLEATKSGVSLAPADSSGIIKGVYSAIDTVINGEQFTYYLYNPGDSTAIYNVSFTNVGEGTGDYTRVAIGNFKFAGIKNGLYLPIILLPIPKENRLGNLVVNVNPFENTFIGLEYAGSILDRNKLSDFDDGDNYGYATNVFFRINLTEVRLGALNLGKIGFSYKDRFIQGKFFTADRINEVEFNRDYNITPTSTNEDESLREIRLSLLPIDEISLRSSVGFLRKGDNFKSDRFNNILKITNNDNYNLGYNFDYNKSENLFVNTDWLRQEGSGYFIYSIFKPGVDFRAEDKRVNGKNKDSLLTGSLKYLEVLPFLQLINLDGLTVGAKYSLRDEYLPLGGIMAKESRATTQFFEFSYSGTKEFNTIFNLTFRDKVFTDSFKEQGKLDNQTILVRSNSKFRFWDPILNGNLFYEVSTKRSSRLENVFVPVEKGTGNYIYLGDLNNNGVADENEFSATLFDGDFILITIPSDELFPVIELKTSTRWKVKYAKIFDRKSLVGSILKPLSTETVLRVEEITREEDFSKIYLLNFNHFLVEGTTIRGGNFIQQDIFLNENNQELSFRFRYTQNQRMNEFNSGVERGYNRERSLRIRFRMVREFSNQTDIVNITNNVSAPESSTKNLTVTDNSITSDFSYRPARTLEVGFVLKVGKIEDVFPEKSTIIDLNSQKLRFNLSFIGKGRLRIEIERSELLANTSDNFIPFELTGGNSLGKNYFWRVNFDYRVASFLQITMNYDGRLQGKSKVIHTARAEARAYF
ncbi:MAG: hypothetical protein O6940_00530 [Ignavibacteria bacterium]|nr:hypothetical protein [Ignavibacteria bacterium]